MVVIIVLNFLFLLLSIIFTIRTKDNLFVISSILFFMGTFFMVMGAMEDYKNNSIKKRNINPAIIEYIVDVRKQNDETSITTDNAITVYLECKRNGFNEEEILKTNSYNKSDLEQTLYNFKAMYKKVKLRLDIIKEFKKNTNESKLCFLIVKDMLLTGFSVFTSKAIPSYATVVP